MKQYNREREKREKRREKEEKKKQTKKSKKEQLTLTSTFTAHFLLFFSEIRRKERRTL